MKTTSARIAIFQSLILTVLLAAAPGSAQLLTTCADDNVLAIFFDNGDINYQPTVNVPFNIYFAIINPTANCVDGVEFRLTAPERASYFTLSRTFPVNAIDIGAKPDYVVGFAQDAPIVSSQAIVMTMQVMVLSSEPGQYFLSPTSIPSIPGTMAYDCNGELFQLTPISGNWNLPVAQFNGATLDYCEPTPLDLSVAVSFNGDTYNIAGTAADATDGFDAGIDLVDNNLGLTFPHPEWSNPAGSNYSHDIKALYDPTIAVKQWTFVATASDAQSGSAATATLNFNPSFAGDPNIEFQLYDRITGATHDLTVENNLQFTYYDYFSRTFDLFIGREVLPPPTGFWVDVTASAGGHTENPNRLSISDAATDGHDPGLDIPEPTPPPANFASSSFIHTDWPLGPRFQTDVRAVYDPLVGAKTWVLRVETDQSGTVVLDFASSFTAADGIGLQLHDRSSGQTFDLFPQMNYAFIANGTSTYWFDITVGVSGAPDLSPTYRQLAAGWSLVGLPLLPASRTLGDVIWDQAPGYAYMFAHQPAVGYDLLDPATTAHQGQGYWMATDTGYAWTMTGERDLDGVTIPLIEGWNLVGNPLWFPGPFEGMAIIRNGVTVAWELAVQNGYVATGVQSYSPGTGSYFDAVDLQPWHGYWVNALEPNLQLVFDWRSFQNLPARLTAAKSALPVDERVWSADLTLWDSKRLQTTITMGINPEATAGFDPRFDMPMPPLPPNGGALFAFTRPEWGLASGAYFSRDVMPTGDAELTWHAVLRPANPGPANLIWDSTSWPKNADFQIYLPTENRVVVMSMRAQSSLRLELGDEPLPIVIRTPNLFTGVDDLPGQAYRVGVHPNPFNPMTTVSFDLPRAGAAEIRIYSVRGELVGVLGGEQFPAGRNEVVWQGRDRGGRLVPSGSYFARLVVDGQAVGSVTKMSLVR